jgi:L-alanine-DL-glutamate epimerase-like enolase superfamily enzyme
MPVKNSIYAALVDRAERLEREVIRAKTHFERIYRASDKSGIVEGECTAAIAAIDLALSDLAQ